MWWKLTGLALLEGALLRWLTRPVLTETRIHDPAKFDQLDVLLSNRMGLAGYAALIAVLLIPVLAWRIFRKRRALA